MRPALAVAALVGAAYLILAPGSAPAVPGPVSVAGNRLVGEGDATIRLLGVDRSGTEYACAQGYGFTDSADYERPDSARMVAAIASWGVNAVRIPLNEACWLGLPGTKARWSGAAYRAKVDTYVERLEDAGIHPILDLHVVDPKGLSPRRATQGLRPAPDAAHSVGFWRSLAQRYGQDRAIVFDLYNEPNAIGWRCLRDGCRIRVDAYLKDPPVYRSAGTQQLVDAIRRSGAQNVIMVPGIDFASNLSKWMAYRPDDPLHRLAASLHTYEPNGPHPLAGCDGACRESELVPLVARYPLVIGEFGDTDCDSGYSETLMRWADSHGVSYLAWAWDATSLGHWNCSRGPALIRRYDGTPTAYGAGVRAHLLAVGG